MENKEINDSPISQLEGGTAALAIPTTPLNIQNHEFIAAVFQKLPQNTFSAVCSKPGNPESGGWIAQQVTETILQQSNKNNNYINCSSFFPGNDGSFNAMKNRFASFHFLMLDDLGTKIPLERLKDFELSWLIETSPGNYQAGIILFNPITDKLEAECLIKSLIDSGYCDPGSSGICRWARFPNGSNGKPKYTDAAGNEFICKLIKWNPEKRYTPEEIVKGLSLKVTTPIHPCNSKQMTSIHSSEILIPRANENPVIVALKKRNLYKKLLDKGKHDITCPWVQEHTDEFDGGTAYYEPSVDYSVGGFLCQHSHRDKFHIKQLLDFLNIEDIAARRKPIIRIIAGDLNQVIDAAEKVLSEVGRFYQSGNLIVTVVSDSATGNPTILPINAQLLVNELAAAATWVKFDGRGKQLLRCDPPISYVNILYCATDFKYLLPLTGIARQPYFRESDGELVIQPGYDKTSKLYGIFDPNQFTIPEPTLEAAKTALVFLEDLLSEFHFVSHCDKSAALSAIFTAVTRATLPFAPAFHIKAPVSGSGKTFLSELIGAFAGPAENMKVSYPTTSEEATKTILSLLLQNPAVIEFDDLDTDLIPHGIIKRMLTSENISDRILGISKTATVSTRTLFLSSGNNVGPVRDLLRRVITIHVDPRSGTPALIPYKRNPVDIVRKSRARYVCAVLTIIQAWRKADSPRTNINSLATYNGPWSDYCRHPLIWLGHIDPATTLISQVTHDPDSDALKDLSLIHI